jgi:hypothetical protein
MLRIDPAGYEWSICIGSVLCTSSGTATGPANIPAGTHLLTTLHSCDSATTDCSLGTLTVDAQGQVTVNARADEYFTDAPNNTLAVKNDRLRLVTVHSQSEDRIAFAGLDLHGESQWTQKLLVGRRYALVSGNSRDIAQ